MSFFATDLAEDASLELSTSTAALLPAIVASAATTATIVVGVAAAVVPGCHVRGRLLSTATRLHTLLEGDELSIELIHGDGLHA